MWSKAPQLICGICKLVHAIPTQRQTIVTSRKTSAVIAGRADVILDRAGGNIHALALVDYKTSLRHKHELDLQLQVYPSAGRREGLNVRAVYLHDLAESDRLAVNIEEAAIESAEERVSEAVSRYRDARFGPTPSKNTCTSCDMRLVCRFRAQ